MHSAFTSHYQNSTIIPFTISIFQFSVGDILSGFTVNLSDHPALSLRSWSQCPGMDSGVQSPWVRHCHACLPVLAMSLSHDPSASAAAQCPSPSLVFRAMSVWDTCLQITVACTVVGAWVGAFPIPLDWERPWQVRIYYTIISFLLTEFLTFGLWT